MNETVDESSKKLTVEHVTTVISRGTRVRHCAATAASLKIKMCRWVVLDCDDEWATVQDVEDSDDIQRIKLSDLEIVSGGQRKVNLVEVDGSEVESDDEGENLYWGEDGFVHFAGDEIPAYEFTDEEYRRMQQAKYGT
jgi:hypothetical protein